MEQESNKTDLILHYDATIPDESLRPCIDSLSGTSLTLRVEGSKPKAWAGLELYLPATTVIIFLTTTFFVGFLRKAGEDSYLAVKKGVGHLWSLFFGDDRTLRPRLISSPPGKISAHPYSLGISFLAETPHELKLKLLLHDGTTREEYDAAIGCFLEFVSALHSRTVRDDVIQKLRSASVGRTVLIAYNAQTGGLCTINGMGATSVRDQLQDSDN